MSGWWSSGDPADCMWYPRHLPQVVVTHRPRDGWKARFWIVCYECDLRLGPYLRGAQAHAAQRELEAAPVVISPRKELPLPSKATTTAEQKLPALRLVASEAEIEVSFTQPGRSDRYDSYFSLSVLNGELAVAVCMAPMPGLLSEDGAEATVVVPAELTPEALVVVQAWIEQLSNAERAPRGTPAPATA